MMQISDPFDTKIRDELLATLAAIQPQHSTEATPTVLLRLSLDLSNKLRFYPTITDQWRSYLSEAYVEATGQIADFIFAPSTTVICCIGAADGFQPGPQQLEITCLDQTGKPISVTYLAVNVAKPILLGPHNWPLIAGVDLPFELKFDNCRFGVKKPAFYCAKAADHFFMHPKSSMSVLLRLKVQD